MEWEGNKQRLNEGMWALRIPAAASESSINATPSELNIWPTEFVGDKVKESSRRKVKGR